MKPSHPTFPRAIKPTVRFYYNRELNFLPLEIFYSLNRLYNYKSTIPCNLFYFLAPNTFDFFYPQVQAEELQS